MASRAVIPWAFARARLVLQSPHSSLLFWLQGWVTQMNLFIFSLGFDWKRDMKLKQPFEGTISGRCAISARHNVWMRVSLCPHEYSMMVLHIFRPLLFVVLLV
jgi:hypothetical protein